jgi:hypothetical protein
MTYKRFSQLWDALVTDRPKSFVPNPIPLTTSAEPQTIAAFVAYANGDKSHIESIRRFLDR